MPSFTLPFTSPDTTLALAGGKAMNLAELVRAGFPVPPGFIITTDAYRAFVLAPEPLAFATEPVPSEIAVASPRCTRTVPLVATAWFWPGAVDRVTPGESEVSDDPDGAGLAEAPPAVATSPTPTPNATASAPIRPIWLSHPMIRPSPSQLSPVIGP